MIHFEKDEEAGPERRGSHNQFLNIPPVADVSSPQKTF
jgi:hypothetical protein